MPNYNNGFNTFIAKELYTKISRLSSKTLVNIVFTVLNDVKKKTTPTHRRTDANLYPPERQLTHLSQ